MVSTDPANGKSEVRVEREFVAQFRGIVDERTLGADAFSIIPEPTAVYSYYNNYEGRYVISWPMQPQTGYTVTLSGEIADIFGNTLGKDEVIGFRTGNRKPFAHLNVPNEVGTYNAYADTEIAVSYRNVSELNFELYTVSEADAQRLLGPQGWEVRREYSPKADALLREWTVPVSPQPNTNVLTKYPLGDPKTGDALPSGMYWLELRAPEVKYVSGDNGIPQGSQEVPRHLLIVSPFNLIAKKTASEILVWNTDLRSGQPVPNIPIRVPWPGHR